MRLVVLLLAWSQASAAATVAIHYDVAPGLDCPDETTLRQLVAARLGTDPFTAGGSSSVTVRVKRESAFVAEVTLQSPASPERRKLLSGASCAELLHLVATTVALTIDPLLRRPEIPESPPLPALHTPAEPTLPAEPTRLPLAARSVPAQGSEAPALRGSVSAGATVGAGASVVAQPRLHLEGRLQGSLVSIGLEVRFGWPVNGPLSIGRLSTSSIEAGLVPCLTWKWLSGCADLSIGGLRLEGLELAEARAATTLLVSVGLRALFLVPLTPALRLGLMAQGSAFLTRASAVVGGARVWTMPPVGGELGLWLCLGL